MFKLQAARMFRYMFVLADTEKLHQKIAAMSDRIRQLEDALAILQSASTGDTHPLLQRDLLKIKSIIELHAAGEGDEGLAGQPKEEEIEESQTIDAFGTLAIRDDGAATFYGRSAGQESLLIGEEVSSPSSSQLDTHTPESQLWSPNSALPPSINTLSSSFPFSSPSNSSTPPLSVPLTPNIDLDGLVHTYLPHWEEAHRLSFLYMEQAPWFFGAVTQRQLNEEVLPMWYQEAPRPPVEQKQPVTRTPHDLALLFILLAFGAMTDPTAMPASPALAEAYYTLTKAALSLAPVLERPPSVATVQTLALMAIFEGMSGGENAIEATWALMGLATKLAQSIGLHRDCQRWGLPPAEVQKRRALFWELFITDCWQSLATGRLATFSLPFVDCELPFDPDQTMTDDGVVQPSFPYWKARFGAECVAGVVQGTLTSRAPRYSIILELDRKVRDMELPAYAQGPPPQGAGLAQTMKHFMSINYRELTLLYIHRCFFAHAITSHPTDPIRSQYAPSFLAGYRSACTIIGSVRQQFELFPAQIARFWVLWTHAFSAAVMLASVVTHSSQSKVAPAALIELGTACKLFEKASEYGGRASKFLPIVRRLQDKAKRIFDDTNNGVPPSIPGDIFRPTPAGGERKDELSIFGGKTHTVITKAAPRMRTSNSTSTATSSSSGSPRSTSNSPNAPSHAFIPVDNPSFAGAHPSLVNELRGFDGHIAAQIREAYGPNVVGAVGKMEMPVREYSPRHHMQIAQRENAERIEMEKRQAELTRQELERRQMERQQLAEQQRLYHEQQEQERRLQQEQQEQYRQQQALEEQQRLQQTHRHQQQQREAERQRQHQRVHSHNLPQTHYDRYEQVPAGYRAQDDTGLQSESGQHYTYAQGRGTQPHPPLPGPPQHSMYVIPPEYRNTVPQTMPSSRMNTEPSYVQPSSAHVEHRQSSEYLSADVAPPATSRYSGHDQRYPDHVSPADLPQPQRETQEDAYQYWAPAQTSVYMSVDQVTLGHVASGYPHQHQHYTPDGALRGIAADDTSLQETWQSYMYKVGSPRHLFED
ncbi:hypothetical protein DXG01_015723 [Tephrocybe rancida]|nr:hypothetical protein DXG01_015723 [Tephrocybe rancida]